MAVPPIPILLFEDDEGQAVLTRDALAAEGFAVEVSATGRGGLARAAQQPYAAYLIDMMLPDLRGVEVLRRIKTLQPDAVAIIVTGHGDEGSAVEAMKLGADDYVVKSPTMGHLVALPMVLREGLERRRLRGDREELANEVWEHARLLEERNAELRRANDALKRLSQAKSDLVSTVSHELRTPLATIKEFTAILADQIAGPVTPDQHEYLRIIMANVDRLARIISDLLDLAKLDAGRIVLQKGPVDVGGLLEDVRQSVHPLAEAKRVTLTMRPPESPLCVFADGDKLTQVLLNLLSNAVKHTDASGEIAVAAALTDGMVQFTVQDTGVGIPPEELPKLFEKFQQARSTPHAGGPPGTGLGLAISKGFVELHGGRIWASSTPGQGSMFAFTVPVYHAEEIFKESLRQGLEHARRRQTHFSIIVVSITNFPLLRERYGLEEADRLLRAVEQILRVTVRSQSGDVVIRSQRGEMIIVLAEVDRAGAEAVAQRLRAAIASQAFTLVSEPVTLALASVTSTYPEDAVTAEELLCVAEERLNGQARDRPPRVLVVDDEPKLREFLQRALEHHGFRVAVASSGPEALERLKTDKVDLILLDLLMPTMDGYEVYHLLKEDAQTRDTSVLIVTGKGERGDRKLGLDSASYNYITKPFAMDDLLTKMREMLAHSR